ncbi:MAG TPA: AraC family transcriptional regulator [Rhizomicrobium sp.]|jgi:AraC-like DNA-binding protein|nr:AraC family transcriptional regulator [Rhizomicrobium sp.]
MAEPSVSAGFASGLLRLAVSKGADGAALLAAAGIAPPLLGDPDNRVPFARYVALMRAAKTMSGDPALALHYGEINISEVSIVGLIGQASETTAEAFAQLNRYVRLVVDVDVGTPERFQLRMEQSAMWIVDMRQNPNDFPELTESAFAQIITRGRRFGADYRPLAVHVTHPDPGYAAEYARVFGTAVTFGSDRNAFRVDPAFMAHRVALLPRYSFGVLSQHADALLRNLESATTTRGRVESLLMPILHKSDAGMDAIADRLGVSRQTLFRKLKAEGTSFAKVLDELRHRLALDYLRARKVSVNETAYLVGFSDPAAFSRAFKRWTGKSPRAMRFPA